MQFLFFPFSVNKLLFAYNTASYITYTTNTYTTNITVHLCIQLKIQTQLLHIACNAYKIFCVFFGQYTTMLIQPLYTIYTMLNGKVCMRAKWPIRPELIPVSVA